MAYVLIGAGLTAGAAAAGGTFTSGTYDTTGANFITISMASYAGATAPVITDSKGNTWTVDRTQVDGIASARSSIVTSTPTSVGAGHTWTVTQAGAFASIVVLAWSGALASAPIDQKNSAFTNGATTLQPGSVTPTQNSELIFSSLAVYIDNSGEAIDSGYSQVTIAGVAGAHLGCGAGYLIQTGPVATNPTWSWTASLSAAACIATYKGVPRNMGGGFLVM